jgi:hypothetical protein
MGSVFWYTKDMAKTSKKRNKPYRGEDAASATPNIHRYSAIERNALSQWWYEKKRIVKPLSIALLAVIIIVWLIIEAIRIIL